MDDRSIRRIIGGISSLPSLPDIYAELTAEIASEDMSLAHVGEIVSRDLALSAKILQLVNSAFFGLPRHTESVAQAVSFLGAEVVRSLALSTSVFQAFEGDVDRFQFKHLWNHSVAVGAVAAAIARAEGEPKATAEDALQAGMLHDVGRLILAAGLPNRYHETIDRADADSQPIWQVERTVFGCDHARIGGYLLGLWGLPDSIVEAVVYHHDPLASHVRSQGFSALLAVNVANRLVALDPADADRGCDELDALRSGDDDSARLDAWLDIARRHGIHTQET
jgi:HD-like signal output (HDOD) protein